MTEIIPVTINIISSVFRKEFVKTFSIEIWFISAIMYAYEKIK